MAASVENRQFSRLEPGLPGVDRTFKTAPPTHRRHEITRRISSQLVFDPSSSSSDDEADNEFEDAIKKGKLELESEPSILDPRDKATADNWVGRNPSLIRLTGKHPFNSEPPLTRLMHHGFITPVPIHYVRNHGYVPKGTWEDWTVEVTGLVKRPTRFTMDQLVSNFPTRQLPVMLVCAGNRRKEQNMVKQTVGFNWGAAAVATSVWRGVPLHCILKRCGILSHTMGALNVCFEGAEDLPGNGSGAKYGTSIKKEFAMDPSRDILLAYMQNGERLLPDHGFPVRMIIPGFIGGRMVKWLKRIIVTTQESDSYYHYKDNRVLPSHVDAELANSEAWWYKPEYIINELNINSVITTPCHEERMPISRTTQTPYTLRGYAYSGGGKKVTRVEVTMDGGETWRVCDVDHPEKPNKYGKYWCWCFWRVEVEVAHLVAAREIAVRAWDETLNTQPENLNWNLMGMMNNCWFRVKINVSKPHNGETTIVFEHPTQPGNQSGGWMAKQKQLEKASSDSNHHTIKKNTSAANLYSMSEVQKHNSADSAWIVVRGGVYDTTRFLRDHPGGADSILINAGSDCTEEFDAIHSDKAKKLLEEYLIGTIKKNTSAANLYSMSQVQKHNSADSAWIVVHGGVYDTTRFLRDHPGGADSILINAGTDCTEEFDAIHSDKAKKLLEEYLIGELITETPKDLVHAGLSLTQLDTIREVAPARCVALVPREKIACKLVEKTSISHDVRKFKFSLPHEDQVLGLPVGKHIFLCATINNKLCMRAYTPTSSVDQVGFVELVVKIYHKGLNPDFPDGGLMSQYLDSLPLGSLLDVKGPLGHIEYTGKGNFAVHSGSHHMFAKRLAMVAGGTGITPIYQVIQAILKDPDDDTEMYLVYANRTEDDILLREELDSWAEKSQRLKIWYVVGKSIRPEAWRYSVGRITESIMREHLPGPADSLALACGPPQMIQLAVGPSLEKMGYDIKNSLSVF